MGTFTALDPFEGTASRPMSLNGYTWVEGNTPNATDPSGEQTSNMSLCESGLGRDECELIRDYGDKWLAVARTFNVQSLTNMNDEAFAAMMGGKVIFEDADLWESRLAARAGYNASSTVEWLAGREISYGPANIPLAYALKLADWWTENANCLGIDTDSLVSSYYSGNVYNCGPDGCNITRAETNLARELESFENPIGPLSRTAYASTWEWIAVGILQSAQRAEDAWDNNPNMGTWNNPRNQGDPVSAYIIALGFNAHSERDRVLYELGNWPSKGGHYAWVEGVQGVIDNGGHIHSWLWNAQYLQWTEQENNVLSPLPR